MMDATHSAGSSVKVDDNTTLIIGDGVTTNWVLTFSNDAPNVTFIVGLWDRNADGVKYPTLKNYTPRLDSNGYTLWIEPALPYGFNVQVAFATE